MTAETTTAQLGPATRGFSATIDDLLGASVTAAVGALAEPRSGQASLARNIDSAFTNRRHTMDKAPTGSGKSITALSAAGRAAALRGERTVISTHALTLMNQYLLKDAPPVIQACFEMFGYRLKVAVLKGVGNYVSISKLSAFVHAAGIHNRLVTLRDFEAAADDVEALPDNKVNDAGNAVSFTWRTDGNRRFILAREIVAWALRSHLDQADLGDRQSCPVEVDDVLWSLVSGGGSGKVNAKKKSDTAVIPKAELAKMAAFDADIVLTNHSLIGIRAATGRQVVIGSPSVGDFDHVIIDEAHVLPGIVRDQGSVAVSSKLIARVQSSGREMSRGRPMVLWTDQGDRLKTAIENALAPWKGVAPQPVDDPITPAVRTAALDWIGAGAEVVKGLGQGPTPLERERFIESVTSLEEALGRTAEHYPGSEVRWIEEKDDNFGASGPQLALAPIAVGGLLSSNVWHREAVEGRRQDERALAMLDEPSLTVPLGVACMSATLGKTSNFELGLRSEVAEHESPFLLNYAQSALHIPFLEDAVWDTMLSGQGRYAKFDLVAHEKWARDHALRMLLANGGRGLFLTAKTSTGKALADHLRAAKPGVKVYSQWDAGGLDAVRNAWKADETSVLVGTKALMTGVDAPGETCSLVWIDRPPRKPANPIDDGRVERMVQAGVNAFHARAAVYAGDAAMDLEQSGGRLIRSMSDGGMFVIADPRLMAGQRKSYGEADRLIYMGGLTLFGHRLPYIEGAEEWLRERRKHYALTA